MPVMRPPPVRPGTHYMCMSCSTRRGSLAGLGRLDISGTSDGMRKTEPLHRASPTFTSTTASSADADSGRKPISSANVPHWLRYASATISTSTKPSVAYHRVRNVPWARQSYTSYTSISRLKNGANSGRGYGPRHTDISSKEPLRDVPSAPAGRS